MAKGKILGKLGAIGKVGAAILAVPDVLDVASSLVKSEVDKRGTYKKIPDILGVPTEEAAQIIKDYDFKFSELLSEPSVKLANVQPGTVVKVVPKVNSSVAPNSFLKLYYVDDAVVAKSQLLVQEIAAKKLAKKEQNKETVANLQSKSVAAVNTVTSKIHLPKKKNKQ